MKQGGFILRQFCMDHEVEVWQVKTACGHISRNADAGMAIAQGL